MPSMNEEEKDTLETEIKDAPEEKPETPTEPSSEKTGEEEEKVEEPKIPLSRLREEREKRKSLEKELKSKLDTREDTKPASEGREEDEETRISRILEKREEKIKREEAEAEKEFDEDVEEYTLIDPTFTEKRATDLVEKYGVSVDGAWKIHQDIKGGRIEAPKPKIPSGLKTTDKVESKPLTDEELRSKSLDDIVEEAKKKAGVQ